MFKLAHLSDIHAGYKATNHLTPKGINLRESDGYLTFSRIVKDMIENEVNAVVIAGDIFHSPTPSVRSIVFVQNQFRRLSEAGIPVYALAGNHDTNDIRADVAASMILDDPFRKIFSHAEPYVRHEIADSINLHMVSHHGYADQKETMGQIVPVENSINIFTTHGSCIDPILKMKLHAEHSPREVVIPDALLRDHSWDYTLLGHIHERGWVGSKDKKTDTSDSKVYYNGSIIRRGFSDKDVPLGKGWTLWQIDSSGVFTPTFRRVAQRPQYDFDPIDASNLSGEEITEKILENLQTTQTDGINFDMKSAPIVRQVVNNFSVAKRRAIDWQAVSLNSQHTAHWDLKGNMNIIEKADSTDSNNPLKEVDNNADVLKVYDSWATKSSVIKELDEDMKTKVKQQARDFVRLGQEEVLDLE